MHQTSNFGGSTLKSNGLNENEGVINYTQRMADRQETPLVKNRPLSPMDLFF